MARPIQADSTATQRRILESATRLFASEGVGQTSMRAIAREAGVTQAAVHHYFGSKDGLYSACMRAMYGELAQVAEAVGEAWTRTSSVVSMVQDTVTALLNFGREHRVAVRLVQRAVLDEGESAHHNRNDVLFPALGALTERLLESSALERHALYEAVYAASLLLVRTVLVEDAELQTVYVGEGPLEARVASSLGSLVLRMLAIEEKEGP